MDHKRAMIQNPESIDSPTLPNSSTMLRNAQAPRRDDLVYTPGGDAPHRISLHLAPRGSKHLLAGRIVVPSGEFDVHAFLKTGAQGRPFLTLSVRIDGTWHNNLLTMNAVNERRGQQVPARSVACLRANFTEDGARRLLSMGDRRSAPTIWSYLNGYNTPDGFNLKDMMMDVGFTHEVARNFVELVEQKLRKTNSNRA
jgi:hypothetical protein